MSRWGALCGCLLVATAAGSPWHVRGHRDWFGGQTPRTPPGGAVFVVVPDTESMAAAYPWGLSAQGAWLRSVCGAWDERSGTGLPAPFVAHSGDAVAHARVLTEWERAASAFFDVSVSPGNQDAVGPVDAIDALSRFDATFPLTPYLRSGHVWRHWGYISSYPHGTRHNSAFLIKRPFPVLVFHLQYLRHVRESERGPLAAWARNITADPTLAGVPVVLITHASRCAEDCYVPLFAGAVSWTRARLALTGQCTETNIAVPTTYVMREFATPGTPSAAAPLLVVAGYQNAPHGGNARVRIVAAQDTRMRHVCVWTFSPITARLDADAASSFELHDGAAHAPCPVGIIAPLLITSALRCILMVLVTLLSCGATVALSDPSCGAHSVLFATPSGCVCLRKTCPPRAGRDGVGCWTVLTTLCARAARVCAR